LAARLDVKIKITRWQLSGSSWSRVLGDHSCVLSFYSLDVDTFPIEFLNLYENSILIIGNSPIEDD
jgi:hypothetical protein